MKSRATRRFTDTLLTTLRQRYGTNDMEHISEDGSKSYGWSQGQRELNLMSLPNGLSISCIDFDLWNALENTVKAKHPVDTKGL